MATTAMATRVSWRTQQALTDTYQYDAFGMPIASTGTTSNSYRYSGERFDSSIGLYDLRARYDNQATGRFCTTDAYEGNIFHPMTFHKYIYARDNPVNVTDPTGKQVLVSYELVLAKDLIKWQKRLDLLEFQDFGYTVFGLQQNADTVLAIGQCYSLGFSTESKLLEA